MSDRLAVEVAYALPDRQWLLALSLPAGSTLADALTAAALTADWPLAPEPVVPEALSVGIWGRSAPLDTVLSQGDRVEIYRPLHLDPMAIRKLRAARAKARRVT